MTRPITRKGSRLLMNNEMHFCALFSGSSGNALYVACGETRLLIDAGLPGKKVEDALSTIAVRPEQISGILVTHEHDDHVRGVGVLARRFSLPVYANEKTWHAMQRTVGDIPAAQQRIFSTDIEFYIGDVCVAPHAIPHDAADPVGFSILGGGKKVAIATDLGHTTAEIIDRVADADLLLLESNHDVDMLQAGPYPAVLKRRILGNRGHLSNADCGKALARLCAKGVRHALLGHLSGENNVPQLALDTVANVLKGEGVAVGAGGDIRVDMTWRDRAGGYYVIR